MDEKFRDEYETGYRAGRRGEMLGQWTSRITRWNARRVHAFMKGFIEGRKEYEAKK